MRCPRWTPVAVAALALWGGGAWAETGKKGGAKEESSFGSLKAPDAAEAKKQAQKWLGAVKKDAGTLKKFDTLWASDKPLLDKVSGTLELGDPKAAKLLADARNKKAEAPTELPGILADKKQSTFFRANLALAYGKALVLRGVYEEALEAFLSVKAEDVVDPSSLFFHRAVCEHSLMLKDKADATIDRLLVDVTDAPERYRTVASLMHFDMLTWQEKDLGWIARKMDNIQRRLDLKRGGKKTQKMQKEVLVRLDEMIKELENQKKNSGGS